MSQYGETRKSLGKHNLAPKKRFGQNFLVHERTAEAIVRAGDVKSTDTILEVGVGLGALTLPLARSAARVIGLEVDSGIIRFHQEEKALPENVQLIHQDVLEADFAELSGQCGGKLKIMANLPYSISNPFIFKLIENRKYVESATIMLQKEVADRLGAKPSTKDYGVPSVLLQSCANIIKLLTLKPAEFHPRPKVNSVVIRIIFKAGETLSADGRRYDYKLFSRIVRRTFNHRRKTILNTLSSGGFLQEHHNVDKSHIKPLTEQIIEEAGLTPSLRPEVLNLEQFIQLSLAFDKHMRNSESAG